MTDSAGGESARRDAREATAAVRDLAPGSLQVGGIDLGPAAEHALFTVLRRMARDDAPPRPRSGSGTSALISLARVARLAARARPRSDARSTPQGVLFVANAPIHAVLARQVVAALPATDAMPAHLVLTAPFRPDPQGFRSVAELGSRIDTGWLLPLAAHALGVARSAPKWRDVAAGQRATAAAALRDALPRLAILAAMLDTEVRRTRPALLAAFNESGTWGRLVPAVARAHGLPAVDLPHAEAADPWGSAGIEYDRVLVYGPRSAAVMREAGIDPARVIEVGALRYDPLIRAVADASGAAPESRRRIVFASQPAGPGRAMTAADKALTLEIALAACAEAAPCELVIRPHPTETDRVTRDVLAATSAPPGVAVHLDSEQDLHELLAGAWLLMTASSQSVYEAAIAGVPSITIHVGPGPDPVPFAREGVAIGCTDEVSSREAVRALTDDRRRGEAVARARAALEPHLGTVDGHAAERVADEIGKLAVP